MMRDNGIQSKVKVLVIDDSAFFRQRISKILSAHEGIEVVGTAGDGMTGVQAVRRLKPDVVTMDVEMPVMDGITAVKKIMSEMPTPVLMLSSYTSIGARATLDALNAGAVDFIPKPNDGTSGSPAVFSSMLVHKVLAVCRKGVLKSTSSVADKTGTKSVLSKADELLIKARRVPYGLVVIGASTGGPVAVQNLVSSLPKKFPVPLVLVIHMPENFTRAFAERLDDVCSINVKEAVDGDSLQAGTALLAPGGKQLQFFKRGPGLAVRIREGKPGEIYTPSIDIVLESAAQVLPDSVLAVILTGMGADGYEGATLLKQCNSTIWSQDEASCVIYGMPQAVEKAGLSDMVLPLAEIGPALVKVV